MGGSYINFYMANGGVVVPLYNDPADALALATLQELMPERKSSRNFRWTGDPVGRWDGSLYHPATTQPEVQMTYGEVELCKNQ